jgi:hypothetical protein
MENHLVIGRLEVLSNLSGPSLLTMMLVQAWALLGNVLRVLLSEMQALRRNGVMLFF